MHHVFIHELMARYDCMDTISISRENVVIAVTSSNCKVKIARFCEFLFEDKLKVNLYTSFHSRSLFYFQNTAIFTVRDTKIGMLSR